MRLTGSAGGRGGEDNAMVGEVTQGDVEDQYKRKTLHGTALFNSMGGAKHFTFSTPDKCGTPLKHQGKNTQ